MFQGFQTEPELHVKRGTLAPKVNGKTQVVESKKLREKMIIKLM